MSSWIGLSLVPAMWSMEHGGCGSLVRPQGRSWSAPRSAERHRGATANRLDFHPVSAGARNLAPYSFFNLFNYQPPIIGFSSTAWKDTVGNIEETGQFVWNLATRPLAEAMNTSSASVAPNVDEFELAGLTAAPSKKVAPPRVLESPVAFECQVTQIIRLADKAGADIDAWLTLGEVVMIHIDERLLKDGVYDTVAAEPILRGGGPADYFQIDASSKFQMRRPR